MAAIIHTRCNSLPSAPHPFVSQFEDNLQRLKGSEATTLFSSSSASHKLDGLQDLHECTCKLLQLPTEQQALAQECDNKRVDDLLEGSLRLLDICSTAKDCLMQSKESLHELQSIIRRRKGGDTGLAVAAAKYSSSRKIIKKAIRKALENLKATKKEDIASSSNKDNNNFSMLSFLKEAEEVTQSSLESLLILISDRKRRTKRNTWSIISKLAQPKRVECDSPESDTSEFEMVDAALQSLTIHKASSIEYFQSQMENLDMFIQDLELRIEQLSRKLIRSRVSLLNIFSQ
ncbi:hypothetical protein TanjilG_17307 [Lupinus angustifolius]|uniref:Uncharacterized protein n=1 Tax=Lupinus angustifolius TaxID=3871 RepID=A0A4P1R145_LUPAN|nr:PREDICTED: uncharacterized protein LOC109325106 [Lupinus angustifolius]OIV99497.1 hypothetical protein TanjilG_17307 [Lupinus angustifolius]